MEEERSEKGSWEKKRKKGKEREKVKKEEEERERWGRQTKVSMSLWKTYSWMTYFHPLDSASGGSHTLSTAPS